MPTVAALNLATLHKTARGWPLRQLRIAQAHRITRGSAKVVVAVIDLGYTFHPHHQGRLWRNPRPTRGDVHGWDCHDDDASLEYNLHDPESAYHKGHHTFIVGEVIACAPRCKVMIVRVGYENPDSWHKGIDYAVEHGARILVMPHGFLTHGARGGRTPLFYRGTDFSYPGDNPQIRRALDDAYDAGCLIFRGAADNRGRRVAFANAALESVFAVGSTNRQGRAADICASADYVEAAAPGGQRCGRPETEHCWSTGGNNDYISFTGGCMASGYAAGAAALAWSRFPQLSNEQLRQVLRNTAQGDGWTPQLGYGVLDAYRAVSLKAEQLCQKITVVRNTARLIRRRGRNILQVGIVNRGVFDVRQALAVVFMDDPRRAAEPRGTLQKPIILINRQIGHTIIPVRGLRAATADIELTEPPPARVWVQLASLDRHGAYECHTAALEVKA